MNQIKSKTGKKAENLTKKQIKNTGVTLSLEEYKRLEAALVVAQYCYRKQRAFCVSARSKWARKAKQPVCPA